MGFPFSFRIDKAVYHYHLLYIDYTDANTDEPNVFLLLYVVAAMTLETNWLNIKNR